MMGKIKNVTDTEKREDSLYNNAEVQKDNVEMKRDNAETKRRAGTPSARKPAKKKKEGHGSSSRKILAAVFCGGVLLCGIGTGISLAEYSSFEFLGKKEIGGDDVETKTITENLYRGVSGNGKVYVHSYFGENKEAVLETSKEVPKDQIQFVVEYNPNNIRDVSIDREELEGNDPYYEGYYDSYYGTTGYYGDVEYSAGDEAAAAEEGTSMQMGQQTAQQEPQSYVTYMVQSIFAQDNSLEVFFTYKDEILQNIKEKKFYEYEYEGIYSVKVRIHPSNRDVVSLY